MNKGVGVDRMSRSSSPKPEQSPGTGIVGRGFSRFRVKSDFGAQVSVPGM